MGRAQLWMSVVGLTGAVTTASVGAAAQPYVMAGPGLFGGYLVRGSRTGERGVYLGAEFSVMRYQAAINRNGAGLGLVGQVGAVVRDAGSNAVFVAGGQAAYGGVGVEAGLYGETPSGPYGGAFGVHLAFYLSIGFVWVAAPLHLPLAWDHDRGEYPLEGGVMGGFKVPFSLAGDMWGAMFRMPSGRPLLHRGQPVLADLAEQSEWTEDLSPDIADLDDTTREAFALAWLDDARKEHASIAAFTRLSAQLLALGAPPTLLEEAHRAALDEIQHAQKCYTLASMYGGQWHGPGPLALDPIRETVADRATIAREALVEGCLGEGMAAVIADVMHGATADDAVKAVWEAVTRDERHHAEYAWELIQWCLETGDRGVSEALASALGDMPVVIEVPPLPEGVDEHVWVLHGRPSPEHLRRAHQIVRSEVHEAVWRHPKMHDLLAATSARRAQGPRSRKQR